MEPLWSPAVATGGNRWQMRRPRKRLKEPKTLAVGCDRLPESFHGKEGVEGSSPSEGLQRSPAKQRFSSRDYLHEFRYAVGMEPLMELPEIEPAPYRSETALIANATALTSPGVRAGTATETRPLDRPTQRSNATICLAASSTNTEQQHEPRFETPQPNRIV